MRSPQCQRRGWILGIYLHREMQHKQHTHSCDAHRASGDQSNFRTWTFSRKILYQWHGSGLCLARMETPPCFWGVSLFFPSSLQKGIPLQAHRHLGGAPKVQVN